MRETDLGITDLTRTGVATQLLEHLDRLSCSGCTQRVPLGLQPARAIHRGPAFVASAFTVASENAALTAFGQSEVFGGQQFRDGKAIVHLDEVKI